MRSRWFFYGRPHRSPALLFPASSSGATGTILSAVTFVRVPVSPAAEVERPVTLARHERIRASQGVGYPSGGKSCAVAAAVVRGHLLYCGGPRTRELFSRPRLACVVIS